MMIKYSLTLYNKDQSLDLTKKQKEILNTLRDIKEKKVGLIINNPPLINKHSIIIEVTEVTDKWHQHFGNILANDYTMRRFCDENNKSRMFKWEVM